jgi:hypothetical protein
VLATVVSAAPAVPDTPPVRRPSTLRRSRPTSLSK